MLSTESRKSNKLIRQTILGFAVTVMAAAVVYFASLGIYSRYLADDYCNTMFVRHYSVLAPWIRYQTGPTGRYSNLALEGLSGLLGPHNIQILPIVMIIAWAVGLIWLIRAVKQLAGWQRSWWMDSFFAASLVFFAILQAPNRFQTFYWRAGMASHFAPLVYLTFFSAIFISQLYRAEARPPAFWVGPVFLIAAFVGSGFSEPPDALLIVASGLALAAVWLWEKGSRRSPALAWLLWTLGGGFLALLVMLVSPGNAMRLATPPPGLATLISRTILYTAQFILDSLRTLPVPTLVSFAIPFLVIYIQYLGEPGLSPSRRRILGVIMIALPVLMYALIAASFAPSIYGQSYPEARARFAGRLMMTMAIMLEGGCFGLLLAQWKFAWQNAATIAGLILLAVLSIYPSRAIWIIENGEVRFYQQWSALWDLRESQILAQKAQGVQDLHLFPLISRDDIKEFDANPNFWVNRCAAEYYGVNSISAPGSN